MATRDETAAPAASPNPPRVALYMSVATLPQYGGPDELDRQRGVLVRASEEYGWVVAEERSDVGSGRDVRPGLKELLAIAGRENRPFDVLLVDSVSRLGRPVHGLRAIVDSFETAGVQVASLAEGQELDLSIWIFMEEEKFYRSGHSRRVMAQRKARQEVAGRETVHAGSMAPRRPCPTCGAHQLGEMPA